MAFEHCLIVPEVELYTFIPLSVTLISFQDHSSFWNMNMQIVVNGVFPSDQLLNGCYIHDLPQNDSGDLRVNLWK